MLTQIGGKRESNFSQPIEMSGDCHKRIQYFLKALDLSAAQATDEPLTLDQRIRLGTALRYFRESAPKHTADEEESLFPRLRSINTIEVNTALAKVASLEADHKQAEAKHREVERICTQWLSNGPLQPV